jgi:hypothetical protein
MPGEVKRHRNSAAQNERGREHISHQRNAHEKYQHAYGGEKRAGDASADGDFRDVNLRVADFFCHTPVLSLAGFWMIPRLQKILP